MRAPVLLIRGINLASVWERSVVEIWRNGLEVPTEYGEKAKEVTLLMLVEEPFSEPRRHVGDVFALVGLESYLKEFLEGSMDKAVMEDKLPYTYHERIFNYGIDQYDYMLRILKRASFSRRAQAVIWRPERDIRLQYPPCLQRIWVKVYEDSLVLQSDWRSRDAFRASNMNMLAITELQKKLARDLGLKVGPYLDFSNSAHIYERSYEDVKRFLKVLETRRPNLSEGTECFIF
jgi:thymidylate synthase (methanogen type)